MTNKTEFNLSKRVNPLKLECGEVYYYKEEDVKEFIRLLKEFIREDLPSPYWNVCDKIDSLAGEKLK
jgi:hypothetical protein